MGSQDDGRAKFSWTTVSKIPLAADRSPPALSWLEISLFNYALGIPAMDCAINRG